MKPVQILHLNTESGWRGGEAQTLLLARGLRDRGHGAIIAAPEGSELARRASEDGLEVWTCRMRGEFDPAAVLQLSRLLRQRHPGLLHY
ncbi:MAG: glycosyl transferase, partial [Acidobacteria bacterium]